MTGSSVFDFEADGISEAIYADECFVRVYNGKTGEVLFSQYHSSCTWYENPVVADVEGNFRANLVVRVEQGVRAGRADGIACSQLDANGVDAMFAGLHCKKNGDCVSGTCDMGLCRCTATAECCAAKTTRTASRRGTCARRRRRARRAPATRAAPRTRTASQGIRVYADANDNWVRSRPIWNQHAYSVTNVNEDGTIPKTERLEEQLGPARAEQLPPERARRRQRPRDGRPDRGRLEHVLVLRPPARVLSAPVCNRGSAPIGAGLSVGFYVGGMKVCGAITSTALAPGTCEDVGCVWASPPQMASGAVDVDVIADDQGQYKECKGGNDHGVVLAVFCKPSG